MSVKRQSYSAQEKLKVAAEAVAGRVTQNAITKKYCVHSTQINRWKSQLKEKTPEIFDVGNKKSLRESEQEELIEQFFKKVGQLEMERDWLKKNLNSSVKDRRDLIDLEHPLSISRQCDLLNIYRGAFYYAHQKNINGETKKLIDLIDGIYTDHPTFGTRKMSDYINNEYIVNVGRKKMRTIYRYLGLEAIYPKPNLSKPNKEHKIYPYLLKDVPITHNNHVWSTDITYIRLLKGFVYLVAIIDWHSRYVLDWE